jgi:RNA polymerase-binding transcription factor DksA
MTNYYNNNEENELSSDTNLRKLGIFKHCDVCGAPIILKKRELYETQNPCNWLLWKKVLVEERWEAFDVDDVNRMHNCKEQQQQQKTLEQWLGI